MVHDEEIYQFHAQRKRKPRILILVDRPGWVFETVARALVKCLNHLYDFKIVYVIEQPDLNSWEFDVIFVFFWGETYHQRFVKDPRRVIKQIASHRWENEEQYGKVSAQEMVKRYLGDAATLTTISGRLQKVFSPFREVFLAPNGVEAGLFTNQNRRSGALKIGWAGNIADPCKGVKDILIPAAGNDFEFLVAPGNLPLMEMVNFYNSVDVFCVASTAEGGPITVLESMMTGCFPVAVEVGIIPDVIQHMKNGLIVERSVDDFRAAFYWCEQNLDVVRSSGAINGQIIASQYDWPKIAPYWSEAIWSAVKKNF